MATNSKLCSEVEYDDWIDIANSELIDFVEGRRSVGFVFEHEEIGIHGIKFDPLDGVLRAVSFEEVDPGDPCPGCGSNQVRTDESDRVIACFNCGWTPDDYYEVDNVE